MCFSSIAIFNFVGKMPRKDRRTKSQETNLQLAAAKCAKLTTFFRSDFSETDTDHRGDSRDTTDHSIADEEIELIVSVSNPPSVSEPPSVSGPPSVSEPRLSSADSSKNTKYKCRVSTLLSWKTDCHWDWLAFDEDGGYVKLVWCEVCKTQYSEGVKDSVNPGQAQLCDMEAYIKGTPNVKKDTARSHNASKLHGDAVKALKDKSEKQIPVIYKHLTKMDEVTFLRMCRLFDLAYTVAFSELAFTNFETLISVEKKHGVDLGNTYANNKACQTFINEIGETMAEDLQSQLFSVEPFYCSILFDGSSDKSLSEKEVISIKLIENGLPKIKLLGIAEPQNATAEGIYNAITAKADEMHLDINTSCVATAADGASVNFGKKSGVLVRLTESIPWLIQMHCVAHRLELALKDAFLGSFYEIEIDNLMMQLYYFYRRSVKRWNELQKTAQAVDEHVVKPSRAQGTRWIDHRRKALCSLVRDYRCIVSQFQEQGSELRKDIPPGDRAKLRGYVRLMTSLDFVLYLSSYQDLVEDLAQLSVSLQAETMPVSEVLVNTEVACASLNSMKAEPGRNLRNALKETTPDANGIIRYHDVELTHNPIKVEAFHKKSQETIDKVVKCISTRFSSFTEDKSLSAGNILDPSNFPSQSDPSALANYGLSEVHHLIHHFNDLLVKKGCNLQEIEREWKNLKFDISRNHKDEKYYPLWQKILTDKAERYKNFLHLVRILLVIPIATAHVERQFSHIKRYLGDWRQSLCLNTIQNLLRICTEGPEPAIFNPERAVNRWRNSSTHPRRPHIMPYGPRQSEKPLSTVLNPTETLTIN